VFLVLHLLSIPPSNYHFFHSFPFVFLSAVYFRRSVLLTHLQGIEIIKLITTEALFMLKTRRKIRFPFFLSVCFVLTRPAVLKAKFIQLFVDQSTMDRLWGDTRVNLWCTELNRLHTIPKDFSIARELIARSRQCCISVSLFSW